MNVLQVHNLSVRYGDQTVLAGINLELQPGQIYGLSGPNGSGKSSLIRALCGLARISSGQVRICGLSLDRERADALGKLGYVAQRFGLYPDLTVAENLRFYARCHGLGGGELDERVQQSLEGFQLQAWRARAAATLSHGWSQRLALAVATCHRPKLLLLDETTAGLDEDTGRSFWAMLQSQAELGTAVLLATHHQEDARQCTRIGTIAKFQLFESGV